MEATRSRTPVQQYTTPLEYPQTLDEFTPPDVSGEIKFNEVAKNVSAYVQANKPRLQPLLDYASMCSGRIVLLLFAATGQYQKRSPIDQRKMEQLQKERNDYVTGVQRLEREVVVLTAVVNGLEALDQFLAQTIADNTGVANTKFAAMDVKRSATENLTTAKKLQEIAQSMHTCLKADLEALRNRTTAAHKQISALITCLDKNGGAPLSSWQNGLEVASGAKAELTLYTPRDVALPAEGTASSAAPGERSVEGKRKEDRPV